LFFRERCCKGIALLFFNLPQLNFSTAFDVIPIDTCQMAAQDLSRLFAKNRGNVMAFAFEFLNRIFPAYVATETIGCALMAAGIAFALIYVATLATILVCHLDDW